MKSRTVHKQKPLPPRRSRGVWFREHLAQLAVGFAIFLLIALYAGLSYISFRPSLQITGVTVLGTSLLHADDVSAKITKELRGTRWGSISKNTAYTAPLDAIHAQLLEDYPEINTVTLSRNFLSSTITATITEHAIYAIWCAEDSDVCYYMTRNGYIFAPASYDPRYTRWYSAVPPVALRANIGGEYMQTMRDTVDGVRGLELVPSAVHIVEENKELRIDLGSWYIRTRTTVPAADTLRFIRAALSSKEFIAARPQLEYLDARFGNRLFYKEKPVEKELVVSAEN